MFKLFHSEGGKAKISDRVFMHRQAKWNYCQKMLTEDPKTIFIGWFDDTIAELENFFGRDTSSPATILNARTTHKAQAEGSPIIFIEHHPMKRKEDLVFEQLGLKEAIILTSLDEPLLKIFGGEKLIDIMQKLGMKEDEIIEHKMVSQSIANAQKKIEERMIVEQSVRSQSEWLERSLK
jgi:hypothetical protein